MYRQSVVTGTYVNEILSTDTKYFAPMYYHQYNSVSVQVEVYLKKALVSKDDLINKHDILCWAEIL
jgi:hypothetical protein